MRLIVGSRRSRMAVAQLNRVALLLEGKGHQTERFIRDTKGDLELSLPLPEIGGKGLFTSELEADLLARRIDLAVHSLKDLPVQMAAHVKLLAVTKRDDPSDCLIGAPLDELPSGAKVGTSSLRRAALLRRLRPDLAVVPIRGNLDTRLKKLDAGQFDAICVATSGLLRLGLKARLGQKLPVETFVPAPGQGMLGIESAAFRDDLLPLQDILQDADSLACGTAERTLLAALGEGCQLPLGAFASVLPGGALQLHGVALSLDGKTMLEVWGQAAPADAKMLGEDLGEQLKAKGAARLLHEPRP